MKFLQAKVALSQHAMLRQVTRFIRRLSPNGRPPAAPKFMSNPMISMTRQMSTGLRGSIVTFAAALFLCAFLSDANCQNLIQNPGFESAPLPPNCGNNIPWPITPWIVAGPDQTNVVMVDGNVNCHYGTNGPQVDATNPGPGIPQHYLDIANGTNSFYQSFTIPACASAPAGTTANITFGGAFSGRGNATSGLTGSIQLMNGVGISGTVIQTLTPNIPGGNSQTTPWTYVSGTAALVYGSTFSFVVNMSDPVNFDDAFLTIQTNPCNGNPPPVIDGCLKNSQVTVSCNANGTYTLTLSGVTFTGTDITLTSQTPGVTVTPPQQPWAATTTWTITGATPGETVVLTANVTNVGGGTAPGSDECCSGQITIVMPDCPKPVGEVIVEKKVKNDTRASTAVINSLVFPIGLSCTAPSNLNVSFGLNNGGTHTENNVPYTSVCSVTESVSTLPAVPKDVCGEGSTAVWLPPVISVTPSATIGAPVTTFTVVNELICKKVGSLIVQKQVIYDGLVTLPSQIYPVTVNCGGTITQLNLLNGVSQTVNNIPLGTSCSVVEGPVPTPPNICRPPTTPVWSTTYVPPSPITITGMGITELVKNTLTCSRVQPNTCSPPQVANAAGICVCPSPMLSGPVAGSCVCPGDMQLRGNECVRPIVCKPPQVLNPAGTACGCPEGTVLRGNECVRPIVCKPPQVLNPAGTACGCPQGTVLRGNECVRPIVCKPPQVLNPAGTACGCPEGTVLRGNECVRPIVCHPPLSLNPAGTACTCPQGTVQRGNECVRSGPGGAPGRGGEQPGGGGRRQ